MINRKRILTPNQITFMLFGLFMGPTFYSLPNLTHVAEQDAWISILIALLYPAYILVISNYIINKFPDSDIFDLNKRFFGKLIGTALNIIFLIQFAVKISTVASQFAKILQVNLTGFLSYNKIIVLCLLMSFYTASRNLKTLAKVNEFFSYLLLLIIAFSFFALKFASPYNLLPVFDSGIKNIMKGAFQSFYAFTGFEILLFIHPYASDINKIKSSSYKALGLCSFIWIWTVIICILFLGTDLIPKTHSAFLFVLGSINIAAISNFRYIFITIWTIIALKVIANHIFFSSTMLSSTTNFKFKNLCLIITILSFFPCTIFSNESLRDYFTEAFAPVYALYNLILFTLLALFASRKKEILTQESKS